MAKRARVRENALYLVFKIVERLAGHLAPVIGGATLMTLPMTGARFRDGALVEHPRQTQGGVPLAA